MTICCSILLRIRPVSDKSCRENLNTNSTFFSLLENLAVYEKKNFVEPGRPQMTVWRIRFSCWIPKVINTGSQHVILCFCTAQMRLSVAFVRTLPVLLFFSLDRKMWLSNFILVRLIKKRPVSFTAPILTLLMNGVLSRKKSGYYLQCCPQVLFSLDLALVPERLLPPLCTAVITVCSEIRTKHTNVVYWWIYCCIVRRPEPQHQRCGSLQSHIHTYIF
jgi:hypothetical protein